MGNVTHIFGASQPAPEPTTVEPAVEPAPVVAAEPVPAAIEPAPVVAAEPVPAAIEPAPAVVEPTPTTELVSIPTDERVADIAQIRSDEPTTPARAAVAKIAERPLAPTRAHLAQAAKWWGINGGKAALNVITHSPLLLLRELRPIARGLIRAAVAWAHWRSAVDWLADAKTAEGNERAKRVAEVHHKIAARGWTSLIIAAVTIGATVVAILTGYTAVVILAGLITVCVLDAVGRKGVDMGDGLGVLPSSPLREGAPMRMWVSTVMEILMSRNHLPTITDAHPTEHGVVMRVHSADELDDKDLEAIERGCQTFLGSASRIQDKDNAAVGDLHILWHDPLDRIIAPPVLAPLSQTIAAPPAEGFGYGWSSEPLLLTLLRTNVLIVGGPGSGKSSAGWVLIDFLSACRDVVIDGIDLSGGPFLPAWGDCIRRVATDRDEAVDLLKEHIDRATRRSAFLSERSRPTYQGRPVGSDNWEPADGTIHILFVDELPLMAGDKTLCGLYAEHQRIGRKAGDTSIAMTQDLAGDTLGATSIRKYPSTLVMLACSREDVTTGLGGGKLAEGWRPDRLLPAEGDDANDAGKAYVWSGRHQTPRQWRFYRHQATSVIHDRAFERIRAGLPTPWEAHAPQDAVEVPAMLAAVEEAFIALGRPERIATAELLVWLRVNKGFELDERQLAAALKPAGLVRSERRWVPETGANAVRGYWWADVQEALQKL